MALKTDSDRHPRCVCHPRSVSQRGCQCAHPQLEWTGFVLVLDRKGEEGDACGGYGDACKSQYFKAIPWNRLFPVVYDIAHKTNDHHSTPNAKCRPSPCLAFFMSLPFRRQLVRKWNRAHYIAGRRCSPTFKGVKRSYSIYGLFLPVYTDWKYQESEDYVYSLFHITLSRYAFMALKTDSDRHPRRVCHPCPPQGGCQRFASQTDRACLFLVLGRKDKKGNAGACYGSTGDS